MSPHWLTAAPRLGSAAQHCTLHDFTDFPPALHTLHAYRFGHGVVHAAGTAH